MLLMEAIVRGRVQGVGYRAFARANASRLGIRGWARNLPDGGVEVQAYGDEAALDAYEARLREGPTFGRVDHLEATRRDAGSTEAPHEFEIR